MDNALIVDGVLIVVLLAGALIGAHRGLFKTLMGLCVVALALVGAVLLANFLTDPITDMIAPKVENAIVSQFSDELDKKEDEALDRRSLSELLEEYHLPGEMIDGLLRTLTETAQNVTGQAKEQAATAFRHAISASVRAVVRGAVHAVLVLVLYIVLLVVLKLLTRALDHVFDLPVLNTLNTAGGLVFGLAEAALLLYVAVYAASRLGVAMVAEHADDTYILPIFLNHSPIEWISSLNHKA